MKLIYPLQVMLLPAGAYLLGSIPWGLILTRLFASADIRRQGSGNIGATNVRRVAGPLLGSLTLAGDFLKGPSRLFLGEEEVGRLDVAVDDPPLVGVVETGCHLDSDTSDDARRQSALLPKDGIELRAFEELHGDEVVAILLAGIVDRHDVGVP